MQGMLGGVWSTNRLGDAIKMTAHSQGNGSGCALKAQRGKGATDLSLVAAGREGHEGLELS